MFLEKLRKRLSKEKNMDESDLKMPADDSGVSKDYLYNSGLIGRKPTEEERAKARSNEPDLQHPTDYHKRTGKVPPGFALKSGYEVLIEPVKKKYERKNLYRPED